MNTYLTKLISVFVIYIFLLSTLSIVAAPTILSENDLPQSKKNINNILISNTEKAKDIPVSTHLPQTIESTNLNNQNVSLLSNNLFPSNMMLTQQTNKIINSLSNNSNYQSTPLITGIFSSSIPKPDSMNANSQALTSIKQWSDLTQSNNAGIQNIKSIYPSDLLVKVNTNNKIEFVVKVKNLNDLSPLNTLFSTYNINIENPLPSLGALVVWVPLNNLNTFLQETSTNANIAFIEPNGYVHVQYVPNDPYWPYQWGPQLIGMPIAWNQELGSRSVKVAVIDTGIDYNNPELTNNYLPIGFNWITNTSNPMDDNGHGTHVAGTIAAAINNGIGVAGIANVSIFAEKFLDSNGYGSDVNAALAINHAVAMGANILSNSWGGTYNSSLIATAVANAIKARVMVVAAAGNYGANIPFFPADLPGVIGVAATDNSDQRASFSDYGNYVDISAPGVGILSTYVNNSYAYLSGTSMATPHVSGLAALLMSKYPSDNATQIEHIIYSTAVDLGTPGWDPYYGWGRIDAGSAINGLQPHNVRAYISAPAIFPVNLNSSFNVSIRNIGLNEEVNIIYKVLENGTRIANGTISALSIGTTVNIPINILPSVVGTYNLTLIVDPVPGENSTSDNIASKYVSAVVKQIDLNIGDILAYSYPPPYNSSGSSNSITPFDFAYNVTGEINPTTYIISYIRFILNGSQLQPITLATYLVNPYTREMTNGPWQLFPYWINTTGLKVNDTVDLFTNGGHEGTVVGTSTYNYYGVTIPTLIINDSYELVVFDKNTGVVLADNNLNLTFSPYFIASYINVHPANFGLYNLKGLIENVSGSPNFTTQIYFLVMNTGTHSETSSVILNLNNTFLVAYNVSLGPGQYQFFNASWTPVTIGSFPLNLIVKPVINETYLTDNYVNATAISSFTYIVVYVYNGGAYPYRPVAGAEVDVYNLSNSLIETGYTDANGTYQTNNLALSTYYVQVIASGYYGQEQIAYIYTPGEILGMYFYLSPLPQRSAQIISPSNGTTVKGGLVNINYIASDISYLQSISIYVNNKYIGTSYIYYPNTSNSTGIIIVPVFTNGTNTILLNLYWYDGTSTNASVIIYSTNVVPMFNPKPGDYLNYRINYNYSNSYELIHFIFGNWLSPTEINVTYSFRYYLPNGTNPYPENITWFPVNILNGFINDPAFISNGFSFYFLSNLGFTNPNGHGSLGDIAPYTTWSNILTVNSMSTLNGINVWTLTDNVVGDSFYISRLTGVLVDAKLYSGQQEIYLLNTSFPLIAPAPTVTGPGKITYELGTAGHFIFWSISGTYPDTFTIMRNGLILTTGRWISGISINWNIDGLAHGTYTYALIAYNVGGWNTTNIVAIKVIDIPQLNSPADITYTIGEIGARIIWNATDSDPNTYIITKNGSFVNSGSWRSGISIIIAVDVLPIGIFSYKIVITDLEGYNATDTVIVKVLPIHSTSTPGFDLFVLLTVFPIIVVLSLHYKNKKHN